MSYYDFHERLAFSRGVREQCDIETLRAMIPGCIAVEKTEKERDLTGVDYVASMRGGGSVLIDAKARDIGCSRWWRSDPEVALETWNVIEAQKIGWTLDATKTTDLVLFTYDPTDCMDVFLVSLPLLRIAFTRNKDAWLSRYKVDRQSSGSWHSECVFVPIGTVFTALEQASRGKLRVAGDTWSESAARAALF